MSTARYEVVESVASGEVEFLVNDERVASCRPAVFETSAEQLEATVDEWRNEWLAEWNRRSHLSPTEAAAAFQNLLARTREACDGPLGSYGLKELSNSRSNDIAEIEFWTLDNPWWPWELLPIWRPNSKRQVENTAERQVAVYRTMFPALEVPSTRFVRRPLGPYAFKDGRSGSGQIPQDGSSVSMDRDGRLSATFYWCESHPACENDLAVIKGSDFSDKINCHGPFPTEDDALDKSQIARGLLSGRHPEAGDVGLVFVSSHSTVDRAGSYFDFCHRIRPILPELGVFRSVVSRLFGDRREPPIEQWDVKETNVRLGDLLQVIDQEIDPVNGSVWSHARLVILSSCESSRKARFSLAFLSAGASTIVGVDAPVPGDIATLVTTRIISNWLASDRPTISEAVREAKAYVIAQTSNPLTLLFNVEGLGYLRAGE